MNRLLLALATLLSLPMTNCGMQDPVDQDTDSIEFSTTAASARARCRVRSGRVRIQIDGIGLSPGTYAATVVNAATSARATSKPQTATPLIPNLDFDFDSTAGPMDKDTYVAPTFAAVGQVVRATISPGGASASTTCTQ